ncbi:MAG: hypothetical protein IKP19_03835 [Oscillospiraceae bacterium]|nr:hypothetical protein [Oscillospiraceae bacterium]
MARTFRMKCPNCGTVQNLFASGPCGKCGTPLYVEQPAAIALYRMGNFMGMANGFSLYLNETPFGAIGNRESLCIPLPYGDYKLHIVCGMNRKCNDPIISLSPQDPYVCLKVHMKPGFIQNKFVIERVDPATMPQE